MIRKTIKKDESALLAMLENGGFDADGVALVKEKLRAYFDGENRDLWFTADDGELVGVAYCIPEPMTNGTWNLLMLWTRNDRHSKGHGTALIQQIEKSLSEHNARLLIVETSGLPEFAAARAFYNKCGFTEEARIKNFYTDGDDKIVYSKPLLTNS